MFAPTSSRNRNSNFTTRPQAPQALRAEVVDAAFELEIEPPATAETSVSNGQRQALQAKPHLGEGQLLSNLAKQLDVLKAQERRLRELIESATSVSGQPLHGTVG